MIHARSTSPAFRAGFFILALVLLFMSACATAPAAVEEPAADAGASEAEEEAVEEEPAADEPEEPAAEPTEVPPTEEPESITFTDDLGREVVIDELPEAIISLSPAMTESLYAIGAGPQMVGRTDYCTYPPEAEELPSIGGFSASSMSIETIISLEPDIVVGGALAQAEVIEALDEAGITAFVIEANSMAEIQEMLLLLGKVTGHVDESEAVVADIRARVDAVTSKVETIPEEERLSVFYEVWHEPLMTTTRATFIGELIELAGGINIFGDLEETYPNVSAEEIINANPDVILGPSSHGDQLAVEVILAREGWEQISAAQGGAIYIVDGDIISRAGPRAVDALEVIAAYLYPDLFAE